MKLYTYHRSSAAYRVRIALNVKSIAYEPVIVHLTRSSGEQRAPRPGEIPHDAEQDQGDVRIALPDAELAGIGAEAVLHHQDGDQHRGDIGGETGWERVPGALDVDRAEVDDQRQRHERDRRLPAAQDGVGHARRQGTRAGGRRRSAVVLRPLRHVLRPPAR